MSVNIFFPFLTSFVIFLIFTCFYNVPMSKANSPGLEQLQSITNSLFNKLLITILSMLNRVLKLCFFVINLLEVLKIGNKKIENTPV